MEQTVTQAIQLIRPKYSFYPKDFATEIWIVLSQIHRRKTSYDGF